MEQLSLWQAVLGLLATGGAAGSVVAGLLWLAIRGRVEEIAARVAKAEVNAERERVDRELYVLREGRLACRADLERQITRTEHDLGEDVTYIRTKLDLVGQALSELAGVKAQLGALERAVNALASRVSL